MIALTQQQRLSKNYNKLRKDYIQMLIELWYPTNIIHNTENNWLEFVEKEYTLYVSECEWVHNQYRAMIGAEQIQKDYSRHVVVNWSDDPLYI